MRMVVSSRQVVSVTSPVVVRVVMPRTGERTPPLLSRGGDAAPDQQVDVVVAVVGTHTAQPPDLSTV